MEQLNAGDVGMVMTEGAANPRRGGPHLKFTEKQIAKALILSAGIRSEAATRLITTAVTIGRYISKSSALQKLENDITERNLDIAEMSLFRNIEEGNVASTIFYLKTKGKHRGYTERTEITANKTDDITIDYKSNMLARLEKILHTSTDQNSNIDDGSERSSSDAAGLELLGEGESTRTD